MAGRSGSSLTMTVTNTPAKDLAYTNCAYCSPTDLRQFAVPGSNLAFALVGDVFVLSIAYPFYRLHERIYYVLCVC
ncbi:putative vesicle-fusing ATPase [Helianthus anomalus]